MSLSFLSPTEGRSLAGATFKIFQEMSFLSSIKAIKIGLPFIVESDVTLIDWYQLYTRFEC